MSEIPPRPDPTTVNRRPTGRRLWLAVGLVLLVFVALRLVAMQQQSFWGTAEQHYYGLFPHHLVQGLAGAPPEYLPEAHQGCGLLWGTACAPVFAAVGPTRGSLRWCNLAWHVGMLAVFALLAARLAGLPGLVLTGGLWALAPPAMSHASHFGWVSHVDAGLLTGGALLLLVRAEDRARAGGSLFLAGLLAGLAAWFHLSALPVVLGLVLAALWAFAPRERLVPAVLGLALGLVPLAVTAIGWGEAPGGLDQWEGGPGLLARTGLLITRDLPGMLGFPGGAGRVLGGVWLCLLGVTIAAGRWRRLPRTLQVGIPLAIATHLAAALASGADLSPGRHLLPLWPWLALAAVACAAGPLQRSPRAVVASAALIGLLGLGLWPVLAPPGRQGPRAWADSRAAYVLTEHPFGAERLVEQEPEAIVALGERTPTDRPALLQIAGRAAARQLGTRAVAEYPDPAPAAVPWHLEGVGEELAVAELSQSEQPGLREVAAAIATVQSLGGPLGDGDRLALAAGGLRGATRRLLEGSDGGWRSVGELELPASDEELLCVAFGTWAEGLGWTWEPLRQRSWCPPKAYAVGLGAGLARSYLPAGRLPEGEPQLAWWAGEVAPELQEAFICGWQAERLRFEAAVLRGSSAPPWPTVACANHLELSSP